MTTSRLGDTTYRRSSFLVWMILGFIVFLGCSPASPDVVENPPVVAITPTAGAPVPAVPLVPLVPPVPPDEAVADVIAVTVSGSANGYQFSVEVRSPDEGCEQYADWWEVLAEDGTLLYRRILAHSHVDEQPFVRSGGPVDVGSDTVVWVRAHMHPGGYGGQVLKGSVQDGFAVVSVEIDFAADVESLEPLPTGCAF